MDGNTIEYVKQILTSDILDIVGRPTKEDASVSMKNVPKKAEVNLAKLEPGTIFKGEIVDIRKEGATILTEKGTIQAGFKEPLDVSIGQRLAFVVKENQGNQVVISPYNAQGIVSSEDTMLYKALQGAGIAATDGNIDMVSTMLRLQMPVDRESIHKMLALVHGNKELPPEEIVQMTKMDIPVTKENMEMYTKWQGRQLEFTSQLQNFTQEFSKMLSVVQKENPFLYQKILTELAPVLTEQSKPEIEKELMKSFTITPEEFQEEKVKEVVKNIEQTMPKIENMVEKISEFVKEDTIAPMKESIQNVNQTMEFMKTLNEQMLYLQLPVNVNQQVTGNNLYVYGKGQALDKENGIRLYMHLDMQALGTVGTLVELKGNTLTLTFDVETKQDVELLEKNMNILVGNLEEKGFLTYGSVKQWEKESSQNTKEVANKQEEKQMRKRYSFDMRI